MAYMGVSVQRNEDRSKTERGTRGRHRSSFGVQMRGVE